MKCLHGVQNQRSERTGHDYWVIKNPSIISFGLFCVHSVAGLSLCWSHFTLSGSVTTMTTTKTKTNELQVNMVQRVNEISQWHLGRCWAADTEREVKQCQAKTAIHKDTWLYCPYWQARPPEHVKASYSDRRIDCVLALDKPFQGSTPVLGDHQSATAVFTWATNELSRRENCPLVLGQSIQEWKHT